MRKLVASADVAPDHVVLEVGCGTGSLTQELAAAAHAVVAVEADPALADIAAAQLADHDNVRLIRCDVLLSKTRIEPAVIQAVVEAYERSGGDVLLVANLPYNVASPLIQEHAGGDEEEMREQVMKLLKRQFRPEFLNRVDETVIFHALTQEHLEKIVDLQMEILRRRVAERGLNLRAFRERFTVERSISFFAEHFIDYEMQTQPAFTRQPAPPGDLHWHLAMGADAPPFPEGSVEVLHTDRAGALTAFTFRITDPAMVLPRGVVENPYIW